MTMITILGSTGFIGLHLKQKLDLLGITYLAPRKDEDLEGKDLGTIIYCIGLTADFRERPLDTVEAHVCQLLEIIRHSVFQKIIYLSSTRVYDAAMRIAEEDAVFHVAPNNPSDLYNISKLMGEAIIHSLADRGCIVRLSNVYGNDLGSGNFLSRIIREALTAKRVILETAMDSEKDYISVNDVVTLLIQIASQGSRRVYNIASGLNISNQEIMDQLSLLTGCEVEVKEDAKTIKFPPISTNLIRSEFAFEPQNLLMGLENLIKLNKN